MFGPPGVFDVAPILSGLLLTERLPLQDWFEHKHHLWHVDGHPTRFWFRSLPLRFGLQLERCSD